MTADNGTEPDELGQACYTLHSALWPSPVEIPWEDLPEHTQECWRTYGDAAIQIIQTAKELPFKDLAKDLRTTVAQEMPWETLPVEGRLAWEAVARFAAQKVEGDEWDSAIDVEFWKNWLSSRLERHPFPQENIQCPT